MIFNYVLLGLGITALIAAAGLIYWPKVVAALPAYLGLCLLHWSTYITVPNKTFIFWGIATAIAAGIHYLSPAGEPDGKCTANLYVGLGAMAGCLLGIIVSARFMTLGIVLGALLGQLAYSRTPQGKWLAFPGRNFWQFAMAKSLTIMVVVCLIGIAVEGFVL